MVGTRCKMAVAGVMKRMEIEAINIERGEVETESEISDEKLYQLDIELHNIGMGIVKQKRDQVVNNVKSQIVELLNSGKDLQGLQISQYIGDVLGVNYKTASGVFSVIEGYTIEKYYLMQRIEKVKELIMYNELTISEIAYKLGFSSVAHLSNQFKQFTRMTTSEYRANASHRKGLDKV